MSPVVRDNNSSVILQDSTLDKRRDKGEKGLTKSVSEVEKYP